MQSVTIYEIECDREIVIQKQDALVIIYEREITINQVSSPTINE